MLTYRYRIYPSEQQKHNLAIHFGHNRYIWNEALRFIKNENNGQYTSREKMSGRLTQIKKEILWLSEAYSQTLQATIKRLDQAYQRFFKKQAGYPKIKKRHTDQSIEFPQNTSVDFSLNCIKIPKIGYIKAKLHRKFKGIIKTCTINKSPANDYYACFVIDDGVPLPTVNTNVELTGIDLGIKDLVITSHGQKYANNKFLKQKLRQLKKAQKVLSRRSLKKHTIQVINTKLYGPYSQENPLKSFSEEKEIFSNRYEKARLKVAKLHRNVVNCRNDYLHKVSKQLVDNHEGLAFESLNIRGMVKNRRLSQSIMDCSWGKLVNYCEYKSRRAGKVCIKIGTFFASSKKCSVCGNKYHGLTLNERVWQCENCGSKHDRDVNASLNISVEGKCLLKQMVSNGEFESQEKPRKSRYSKKKKGSALESDVKQSAGLAERGEEVSREFVSAHLIEACQEKHLGI
jgi:putative transposase